MTTPYKVICLTADGAQAYRTDKPNGEEYMTTVQISLYKAESYFEKGLYHADLDKWVSSGENIEFAQGEAAKLFLHLNQGEVIKPIDITNLVEVKLNCCKGGLWSSCTNQCASDGYHKLYFRSPNAESPLLTIEECIKHSKWNEFVEWNNKQPNKLFTIIK